MTQLRWVKAVNDRITELQRLKSLAQKDFIKYRQEDIKAMVYTLNLQYGLEIDFLKTLLEELEQPSEQGEEGWKDDLLKYIVREAEKACGTSEDDSLLRSMFYIGATLAESWIEKNVLSKEVSAEGLTDKIKHLEELLKSANGLIRLKNQEIEHLESKIKSAF